MRTTIRIDESLLQQAKQIAARRKKTLSAIIEDALRELFARQQAATQREPVHLITFTGKGLQPGVDLDDSAAVSDVMYNRKMADVQVSSRIRSVRTRLFSVDEYERLINAGILQEDERIELLRGEIISMAPIGSRHVAILNKLNLLLTPLMAAQRVVISIQSPFHMDDYSEPQPDLVIAHFRPDFYYESLPIPADILLLVEVADSSEEFDRSEKVPLYARSGIAETWLININHGNIEAYRTPSPEGYRDVHTYVGEERLSPAALPDFSIAVNDLFPKR